MRHILVVDDEVLMRFSLSAVLKNDQAAVTAVGSGAAALQAIDGGFFDVCFLDLHLPDINGLEVMQKIRQVSPSTRIAIMSGSELSSRLLGIIGKHAQLFLEKPFDLEDARRFAELGRLDENFRDRNPGGIVIARRRSCERNPVALTIRYSVLQADRGRREDRFAEACVIDISAAGVGVRTSEPLQPGQRVELVNGPDIRKGTVRWSLAMDCEKAFRSGIQYA